MLTDEEFEAIFHAIRKELTDRLAFLNERVNDISLTGNCLTWSLVLFLHCTIDSRDT